MFPLVSVPPSVTAGVPYVMMNLSAPLPGSAWSSTCAWKLPEELFGLQVPENSAVVPVSVVTAVTVQSRCAPVNWSRYLRWPLPTPPLCFALKPKLPIPPSTLTWPPPVTLPDGGGEHG